MDFFADENAYEELVRQHQEAAFRLAYLITGDADEAQDVAQEAFIRAYHARHTYDASRPVRPWLLTITANLARNRRRSIGRYLGALGRLMLFTPTTAPNIEHESLQRSEARELWQAIQKLGIQDQEVIYLRYMLELSVAETAEVLGVEQGTVKSRLSRALKRLRGVVEADFPLLYEGRRA